MNRITRRHCLFLLLIVLGGPAPAFAAVAPWQAGVARAVITPTETLWMSGYSARTHPADGKLTDLWAKAICLQDPKGVRVLLITLDLVGIDREMSLAIREQIEKRHDLKRSQIALCTSHTHSGPVVGRNLGSMYFFGDDQKKLIHAYTEGLIKKVVALADEAIGNLKPATLAYGSGTATFAVNRRNNREADVSALREQGALKGPVDHDVPVLKVTGADGKLIAAVFGYACHATTLSGYQWCADYPGYAQIAFEKAHPGAVALFWAGCGGDQNPLPRRKVELAEAYGQALADAVAGVLAKPMRPVTGALRTTYKEIDLPFGKLPTRDELEGATKSDNRYVASRARLLLQQIAEHGTLVQTYPYPVQTWRLGDDVLWVVLGGEVVVDYALRLKKELNPLAPADPARQVWVTAYANDVMAYIPSLRVLKEGGYEGGGAMLYYGLPSPWGEAVEDLIVEQAHVQADRPDATP
jgi:Neutral/alkaline non-lysosomal ceramidase, N-terminal